MYKIACKIGHNITVDPHGFLTQGKVGHQRESDPAGRPTGQAQSHALAEERMADYGIG